MIEPSSRPSKPVAAFDTLNDNSVTMLRLGVNIDHVATVRRLCQSRAIALDMESATIAANGFRFRVPYGTLLCVSDKPLHGEIKLAGMAGAFYRQRVGQHVEIGLNALEKLKAQERERLHSRKLRSFSEVAFQ